MSFCSKLFSKKEIETIEALHKEFESLLKKVSADFIILVGLTGKIKGMDIINVTNKNDSFGFKQLKLFAAKSVEFFSRFKALEFMPDELSEPVKYITFYYNTELCFHVIPIPDNDSFVIIALNSQPLKILSNLKKICELISVLKPEKDELS